MTKKVKQLQRGDVTPLYGRVLSRRGRRVHFDGAITGRYWYTFDSTNHIVVVNV